MGLSFRKLAVIFVLLLVSFQALAVIETYEFASERQRLRYQHLTDVLRCPKCQNQNLAGSNSPIAADLRREIADQIISGATDEQIIDFMVTRYGDFILYEPPLRKNTLLLWLAPALLLLTGILVAWRILRSNKQELPAAREISQQGIAEAQPSQARWKLLLFVVSVVLAASVGLYVKIGAWQVWNISRLAKNFFTEMRVAAEQHRTADPAYAQQLIRALPSYLGKHPEDISSAYVLALAYVQAGDYVHAAPYYKQYLLAVPTDEQALTEYVQVLYLAEGKQLTEHVQFVINRALALNSHNVDVLGLLAFHYFEAGDYRQAVQYWKQVLQFLPKDNPSYPVIQQAIKEANKAGSSRKLIKKNTTP